MVISASRRTDIPAFYARWFLNRIRTGFCEVPNPFNPQQVARVSLAPSEVDLIVFWTRNPRPLMAGLKELDELGYSYYFQYTLLDNPAILDPNSPPAAAAQLTFRRLADQLGPQRVIWRYDPIVLSQQTPVDFHRQTFERLSKSLSGYTLRCVISLVDAYARSRKRMAAAVGSERLGPADQPSKTARSHPAAKDEISPETGRLLADLAQMAQANGMEMVSCAEPYNLQPYGIRPGSCIDGDLVNRLLGVGPGPGLQLTKDPYQRQACGCVTSRDIGMYESCLFGCAYCYATGSFERARRNYQHHDPDSPRLFGS